MDRSCRISTCNLREFSQQWMVFSTNATFFSSTVGVDRLFFDEAGEAGLKCLVLATCIFGSKVFRGLGVVLGGSKCSLFSDSHVFLSRTLERVLS